MKFRAKTLMMAILAMVALAMPVRAATIVATSTAEIRVDGASSTDSGGTQVGAFSSGIRVFSGATSTLFFNVEGSAMFPFEDFPVADFVIPAQPGATGITSATLTMFEDPAGFAAPGTIQVYMAANSDPNLINAATNPANGVPSYQTGFNGLAAIHPAFGPFAPSLGSAAFNPTGAHHTPTAVPLTIGGAALAHMLSVVQTGGTLRMVVAPGTPSVAATFAGLGNLDPQGATVSPPTLSFTVVPEPGTIVMLLMGATAAAMFRRRRGY
jgi:hypothetical protein